MVPISQEHSKAFILKKLSSHHCVTEHTSMRQNLRETLRQLPELGKSVKRWPQNGSTVKCRIAEEAGIQTIAAKLEKTAMAAEVRDGGEREHYVTVDCEAEGTGTHTHLSWALYR